MNGTPRPCCRDLPRENEGATVVAPRGNHPSSCRRRAPAPRYREMVDSAAARAPPTIKRYRCYHADMGEKQNNIIDIFVRVLSRRIKKKKNITFFFTPNRETNYDTDDGRHLHKVVSRCRGRGEREIDCGARATGRGALVVTTRLTVCRTRRTEHTQLGRALGRIRFQRLRCKKNNNNNNNYNNYIVLLLFNSCYLVS